MDRLSHGTSQPLNCSVTVRSTDNDYYYSTLDLPGILKRTDG